MKKVKALHLEYVWIAFPYFKNSPTTFLENLLPLTFPINKFHGINKQYMERR
jgi:hypothetical protein